MPSPRAPLFAATTAAIAALLPAQSPPPGFTYETLVDGPLQSATAMAFLPDGRLLITERATGNIRLFRDGALDAAPWATIAVASGGAWAEQGLLGIAVDPAFLANGFVYVFYTDASGTENRIARLQEAGGIGTNLTILSPNGAIPSVLYHNGGAMVFGCDGTLYVATGDALGGSNAQDPLSWLGKVLRFEVPALGVPANNPFAGSPIFSLGHRNQFGLAIHPVSGRLYQTENGGALMDELNMIRAGGNHGWPLYEGFESPQAPAFVDPLACYQPTIAPTGTCFYRGDHYPLQYRSVWFVADYNQGRLRAVHLDATGTVVTAQSAFDQLPGSAYGVLTGPDGNLWVLTNDNGGYGADELGRYVHVNESVPSVQALSLSHKTLGASMTIGVHAANGDFALPWLSLAQHPVPLPTMFGNLWVAAEVVLPVVPIAADGRGYLALPVPNVPAFLGSSLHTQAMVLSFVTGMTLTNPSRVVVQG